MTFPLCHCTTAPLLSSALYHFPSKVTQLGGIYRSVHANMTRRKDSFWDTKTRPETQI